MAWYQSLVNSYYSKIILPAYLRDNLPRDQITDIIDTVPLSKVVSIIAPSGYGKTQASLQWLRMREYRCAYYCPDKTDNRSDILVRGLAAAILSALPPQKIDTDFCNALKTNATSQTLLQETAVYARYAPGNYAFIIKNLHQIGNLKALEQLIFFVQSILGSWKVIIIDTEQLPPVFNHMIITGHIHPLTAADLQLSAGETGMFLKRGGFQPTPDDIENIWSQTKGWLAALNAILKTSIEAHRLHYGVMDRNIIEEYFEAAIWRSLDDSTRDFLMKTSIPDGLGPSVCRALTDTSSSKSTLVKLHARGIFVTVDDNGLYQYHPAFKEFLLRKLKNSNLNIKELYIRYGWWLYSQREYVQAFQCFFKYKYYYGMNWMMQRFNPTVLPYDTLLEMSEEILSFDPYELKQYPHIVEKMALVEYLTGNLGRMRELKAIFLDWARPGVLSIDADEYAEFFWESGWLAILDPEEDLCGDSILNLIHYKEYTPHTEALHKGRMAALGFPSIYRGVRDFSEISQTIKPFFEQSGNSCQELIRSEYALLETRLVLAEYLYETDSPIDAMRQIRLVLPKAAELTHAKLYFCCIALLVKAMRALGDTKEIGDMSSSYNIFVNQLRKGVEITLTKGMTGEKIVIEAKGKTLFLLAVKPLFKSASRSTLAVSNSNAAQAGLGFAAKRTFPPSANREVAT